MRQPKIIVVGGWSGWTDGDNSRGRIRRARGSFFHRAGEAIAFGLRAGRHQRSENQKGEGDTTAKHFDDTIYGGDFLANQRW